MEKPLEGDYLVSIITGHKGKRISVFVNSSGAADAVDIGVCVFRHIVIDDVGNAQDIETVRSDTGLICIAPVPVCIEPQFAGEAAE